VIALSSSAKEARRPSMMTGVIGDDQRSREAQNQ
jgi:hypothetical protein